MAFEIKPWYRSEKMRKKIFGIATLILLVLTILSTIIKSTVKTDTAIDYKQTKVTGFIERETEIEYVFTPKEDIVGMKFLIGTYGKKITKGKLIVTVYDYKTNEEIATANIEAENLRDNQFAFADTGLIETKDRKLKVTIHSNGFVKGRYIALWLGDNSLDEDGDTRINNRKNKENLIVTTCYLVKDTPYTWELVLLTAVCFLIFIMQWNGKSQQVPLKERKDDSEQEENY